MEPSIEGGSNMPISEAEKQEGHAQLKNPPSDLLSYDPKTIITKQGMKEQHGIRALHREKHGGEE